MKTRKVGKLVSLILAIVLVATIMIPAVNVLADDVATKTSFDDENCIVITTAENDPESKGRSPFKQLQDALESASTTKKTYIKLDTDVSLPEFSLKSESKVGSNSANQYVEHVYAKVTQVEIKKKDSGLWSSAGDRTKIAESEWGNYLIGQGKLFPEFTDVSQLSNIAATPDNADKLGLTGKGFNAGNYTIDGHRADEKVGLAYEENILTVYPDTDVVLDINGHTVTGVSNNSSAYEGEPKLSSAVFVVRGNFTLMDRAGGGTIEGGAGYVGDTLSAKTLKRDDDRWQPFYEDWSIVDTSKWGSRIRSEGKYAVTYALSTRWLYDAKEARGGGVYVADGATFTLLSGKITKNSAWMESGKTIFDKTTAITKGGGVYVSANATFNMYGGEIVGNASRAYNKHDYGVENNNAEAYGGGIYLEGTQKDSEGNVIAEGAVFNMTGGRIAENAVYAETYGSGSDGPAKAAQANGAGVYVGEGSVCNIMGSAKASGEVTEEMMASFPQVTNNSCGAETRNARASDRASVTVQGAGIYCAGTLNIEKASITANDFSEAYNNLASSSSASAGKAVHVMRDDSETKYTLSDGTVATKPGTNTGLALYIFEYNNPGPGQTPKTYITHLDPRFKDNLELATELVTHESSGFYGTGRGSSSNKMITDGAGVYMATTGTINIGERTWIYDNYDLVTTGHKSFENSRNYKKYWVQEYTYRDAVVDTDLSVSSSDHSAAGKEITDAAGRYVYYGSYSENCNNGYCWSDTRDDVYLPDGVAMYKGNSLFECRIGVNYYNMVNDDGAVRRGDYGQAGNRVIVKSSSSLDPDIWGGSKSTPSARDIQFFYLNDNNKNYECGIVDPKTAYKLPSPEKPSNVWLCNPGTSRTTQTRDRVAAITASTYENNYKSRKNQSPYEGYINYDREYPANTWIYTTATAIYPDPADWTEYNQATYRISDPSRDPNQDKTIQTFDNAIVNLPQRAYQLTDDMIKNLPKSYRRAKYMDYKVVYDNNQFGSPSEPVLRFGQNVDRQMYFTVDFDEANIHYYGKSDLTDKLQSGTDLGAVNVNTLNSSKQTFVPGVDAGVYYYKGASNPQGTVTINPIVPDYNVYKDNAVLDARSANRSVKKDDGKELTSITKDANGIEDEDLFFKGWSLYVSYGYKDENGNVVNASVKTVPQRTEKDDGTLAVEGSSTINNLKALNYHNSNAAYVFDLSRIYNPNVNAQPCLSMTATWYTKEELEEARTKVSNVMCQTVQRRENGSIVNMLRFVAIAGSDYPDFDAVGFVISTTNATPTIEGGYDYSVKTNVYEKLGVNKTVGAEKMYYDTDKLLAGTFDYTGTSYEGKIVDAKWKFTEGSKFKANLKMGTKAGQPYYQAGIFYTNIIITDENADQVYFVTPYAKQGNTYYYGESRAVCYNDRV